MDRYPRRAFMATTVAAVLASSNAVSSEGHAQSELAPRELSYYVYVAAESEDRVDLVRFDGTETTVVNTVFVGRNPTEIDGPHGLAVDPAGARWYVSLAHGNPAGVVAAYSTQDNRPHGSVELGLFPATMEVTPGGLLFAANFNLHGSHVPSSVSVVDVAQMVEVVKIPTCVMPHGSRLTSDASRHYSVCMMDDVLVEVDAHRLEVSRRFDVTPGREGPWSNARHATGKEAGGEGETDGEGTASCGPTWAQPAGEGRRIYVACNKNAEVLEIDGEAWELERRFSTGAGPYNLAVTEDGARLVVTHKTEGTTGIWDLVRGEEVARVANSRALPHGIALSPNSRYAFVSIEGIGSEPGAVDVIDLTRGEIVSSVDVGRQAGGISFWRIEESP